MKLYLDDTRMAPEGYILVRTYKEMVEFLENNKSSNIEEISLDHDLGSNKSGYDICLWLIENEFWPNKINIHSANIVGVKNMYELLDRYAPKEIKITNEKIQGY
jgi:hypothetical protein